MPLSPEDVKELDMMGCAKLQEQLEIFWLRSRKRNKTACAELAHVLHFGYAELMDMPVDELHQRQEGTL